MKRESCICSDPGCTVKHGSAECGTRSALNLRRVDMGDDSPMPFCEACGADALESGVFADCAWGTDDE